MKLTNLSKVAGAGVLALSLAVLPSALSASAQDATSPNTTDTNRTVEDESNDFDWGLLGLLGLAGLAGLNKRRDHDTATRYRDPNEVGTGTRY